MIGYLKTNYRFILIILGCLLIIYNLNLTINRKDEEIRLLDDIKEEFTVGFQNMSEELKKYESTKLFSDKVFNECPECEKCEKKDWDGPPCPTCKECPQFYNNRVIYKDLVTRIKVEFPDYDMLHNYEKELLHEIFVSDNYEPKPSRDREYFPYNVNDQKINMDNVIPSMA